MSQTSVSNGIKKNGHNGEEKDSAFNVHSIYLKDLSFEAPHSPQIFNEEWIPKIDFDLQMGSHILSEVENVYEVVLHITVTIKIGEGEGEKSAFLIDVQQAGVFTVQNFSKEVVQRILATTCATVLFPYARENISNLATKGGFPQLILPPINFDAMYAHHISTQTKTTETAATTTT